MTAFDLAQRFIGTKETQGVASNPIVLAMLTLDAKWPQGDDVPWCSAFLNFICWLMRLPRSKDLRARSWLHVGQAVALHDARIGYDVVILSRGANAVPASVIDAPGHVGLFAGHEFNGKTVAILAGNQGDAVSVESFPVERVLGVRRLA